MSVEDVRSVLQVGLPALFDCVPRERGDVRVNTPFLLPDGDVLSIFLVERNDTVVVSDYGTAFSWLKMQSYEARVSPQIRSHLSDITEALRLQLNGVHIEATVQQPAEIPSALIDVSSAVVRVAELRRLMYPDAVTPLERFDYEESATDKPQPNSVQSAD